MRNSTGIHKFAAQPVAVIKLVKIAKERSEKEIAFCGGSSPLLLYRMLLAESRCWCKWNKFDEDTSDWVETMWAFSIRREREKTERRTQRNQARHTKANKQLNAAVAAHCRRKDKGSKGTREGMTGGVKECVGWC